MLEAASTKQQLTRALVRHALQTLPHGFDALDTNLIFHASLVSDAYDKWYRVFAQAVRVCIFPSTMQCSRVYFRQSPLKEPTYGSLQPTHKASCREKLFNLHAAHNPSWHKIASLHADDRALAFS